uniref:Uncharacterized protein n=1 Tax=Glossina pallidipes TaxID=7398 RepID=A0A1B0A1W5_GLOPL
MNSKCKCFRVPIVAYVLNVRDDDDDDDDNDDDGGGCCLNPSIEALKIPGRNRIYENSPLRIQKGDEANAGVSHLSGPSRPLTEKRISLIYCPYVYGCDSFNLGTRLRCRFAEVPNMENKLVINFIVILIN